MRQNSGKQVPTVCSFKQQISSQRMSKMTVKSKVFRKVCEKKKKKKSDTTQAVLTIFCRGFRVCMLKLSCKQETSLVGNNSRRCVYPGKIANEVFHADCGFQKWENAWKWTENHVIYANYTNVSGWWHQPMIDGTPAPVESERVRFAMRLRFRF